MLRMMDRCLYLLLSAEIAIIFTLTYTFLIAHTHHNLQLLGQLYRTALPTPSSCPDIWQD